MVIEDQRVTQECMPAGTASPRRQKRALGAKKIKVAIADDHDFLRQALRLYLEAFPDVECVGEASDGGEAIRLVQSCDVDVLLLDLCMPHVTGEETIKRLPSIAPHVKAVVLSFTASRPPSENRERSAVAAYLEKGCHPEKIDGGHSACGSGSECRDIQNWRRSLSGGAAKRLQSSRANSD